MYTEIKVSPKMPNGEYIVRRDVVPIGAIFEVGNEFWIRRNGCGYGGYPDIPEAVDALVNITERGW